MMYLALFFLVIIFVSFLLLGIKCGKFGRYTACGFFTISSIYFGVASIHNAVAINLAMLIITGTTFFLSSVLAISFCMNKLIPIIEKRPTPKSISKSGGNSIWDKLKNIHL